jgi:hypothetical protein
MKRIIYKITNWEAWPFELIYAPLVPVWIYYIIKSRSVWFFTPSNPKITFGGMEGEPKREMYDLLPMSLYPKTLNVLPTEQFNELLTKISASGIQYPFVVKPEVGGQGILFRKIDDTTQLEKYHRLTPTEYIVQEMVTYPMEVSVFYIRHPKASKGKVTGFLHKIPLQVKGDGKSTLSELVANHPKGSKRTEELQLKHTEKWNTVIPEKQSYMLSYAANHNRGAHFIDLKAHIDEKLVNVFDQLSHQLNDFFYGRYDIMCYSIEDLKEGNNYSILEYNGCGAEPNHFYDTGYTLLGAYKEILSHWKDLYEISSYNSAQGTKPWSFMKGYRFLKKTKELYAVMRKADKALG